jgi:hypothetical protein
MFLALLGTFELNHNFFQVYILLITSDVKKKVFVWYIWVQLQPLLSLQFIWHLWCEKNWFMCTFELICNLFQVCTLLGTFDVIFFGFVWYIWVES